MNMVLDLKCVVLVEEEEGSILRSSKIILHLLPHISGNALSFLFDFCSHNIFASAEQHSKPYTRSSASFIKLAFSNGGLSHFKICIQKSLLERAWEKHTESSSTSHSVSSFYLNQNLQFVKG